MKNRNLILRATIAAAAFVLLGVVTLVSCSKNFDEGAKSAGSFKATKPTADLGVAGSVTYIRYNRTLTSDTIYILRGDVRVDSTFSLTIPAGTIIKGDTAGYLIITRGAKLFANGTSTSPVVFTSVKAAGSRAPQDWGGVVLLGSAPVNQAPSVCKIEGIPTSRPQEYYGGSAIGVGNSTDNSGSLTYVRIEFGGIDISGGAGNETNGLTMGGVGSGTTIEHIMVLYGGDDGFEWFGGTVNCKYLISYGNTDDDFDTDYGFSGTVQYGIGYRLRNRHDVTKNSSNGFESDNDASGTSNTPYTSAWFSNFTMVGPADYLGTAVSDSFGDGLHLRRNTHLNIINSIIVGYRRYAVNTTASSTNPAAISSMTFAYNTVVRPPVSTYTDAALTDGTTTTNWINAGTGNYLYTATVNSTSTTLPTIVNYSGLTTAAWISTSPVLATRSSVVGSNATSYSSNFTANTDAGGAYYRGAVPYDGSSDNGWNLSAGWVNYANAQTEPYTY